MELSCCCPPLPDLPFMYGDCEKKHFPSCIESHTLEELERNINRYIDDLADHFLGQYVPFGLRMLTVDVLGEQIAVPFNECAIKAVLDVVDFKLPRWSGENMGRVILRPVVKFSIEFEIQLHKIIPPDLLNASFPGVVQFEDHKEEGFMVTIEKEIWSNLLTTYTLKAEKTTHSENISEFWQQIGEIMH